MKLISYIAVCSLVAFLACKPLIDLSFHINNIDYEFCEYAEDKEGETNEPLEESYKENNFYTSVLLVDLYSFQRIMLRQFIRDYFLEEQLCSEHYLEIIIPPPQYT